MIEVTTKQQVMVGGGVSAIREARKGEMYREPHTQMKMKHHAVNLPKNLIVSDSEDEENDGSSEEDNEQCPENMLFYSKPNSVNVLNSELRKMTLNKPKISAGQACVMETVLRKLKDLEKICQTSCKDKGLKARSPYRNRLTEHSATPFDRTKNVSVKNMTVNTALGSGAKVFVQNVSVSGSPRDSQLLDAIQDKDFLASLNELTSDHLEELFNKFIDDGQTHLLLMSSPRTMPHHTMTPELLPASCPQTITVVPPAISPNIDPYDSCYESASPCSTSITSPSPCSPPNLCLSPPRTSVSSESDQELDPAMENRILLTHSASNIAMVPRKIEKNVTPLGEVVDSISTSACQRLYDLSQSTSFCVKHFTIQLVRVVMSTKAQSSSDRIEGFSKSLMSAMKSKVAMNKAHEGDIWKLSIYAHIQFLMAPDRVEYRPALLSRDERGRSLFYIAAVERFEKPLSVVARYVAESLAHVGYNPLEQVDDKGNTILHVLAELGDSHIHVLSELLKACHPETKRPLFSLQVTNSLGQTPLHAAAQSPHPHLTTVVHLLKEHICPLEQDKLMKTALHYHLELMARRVPRLNDDFEILRRMLQIPVSFSKESLQILNQLCSDPTIPSDIRTTFLDAINAFCVRDLKPKKIERRQ